MKKEKKTLSNQLILSRCLSFVSNSINNIAEIDKATTKKATTTMAFIWKAQKKKPFKLFKQINNDLKNLELP